MARASDKEAVVLAEVLDSLRRPCSTELLRPDRLVTKKFVDAFCLRLLVFHGLHSEDQVMTKKAFEFAFARAAAAAGHRVRVPGSATSSGSDLFVGKTGVSLKTEADQNIRTEALVISKVMESIWTKSCRRLRDFVVGIRRHVLPRLRHSKRVFTLRAHGRLSEGGEVYYELVEIPRRVLEAMRAVKVPDFRDITSAGGTSVPVMIRGTRAYTLVFDGSDQKITIRGLDKRHCIVRATWTVRKRGSD